MQRLKTRVQMQPILRVAPVAKSQHFALHMLASQSLPSCVDKQKIVLIAAMLPKRFAKRAVTRNCIRRHVYAVVFENKSKLQGMSLIVRLRRSFLSDGFVSAKSKLLQDQVRTELQQMLAVIKNG